MAELQLPDKEVLIDIEAPVSIGTDWWILVELGLLLVSIAIVVMFFTWFRRVFWGSLKVQYQLKQSLRLILQANQCTTNDVLRVNDLFVQAKKSQQLDASVAMQLTVRFNQLCFSGQDVSCETFKGLLDDFIQALQDVQPTFKDLMLGVVSKLGVVVRGWLK